MFNRKMLAATLLATGALLMAIGNANALSCAPMSNSQANTQLDGKWLLTIPHQNIAGAFNHFSTITLSSNGVIIAATGEGLPITGSLTVLSSCAVTGTIKAKYRFAIPVETYVITGVLAKSPSNTVPSGMVLRAKRPGDPAVLFSLTQSP